MAGLSSAKSNLEHEKNVRFGLRATRKGIADQSSKLDDCRLDLLGSTGCRLGERNPGRSIELIRGGPGAVGPGESPVSPRGADIRNRPVGPVA